MRREDRAALNRPPSNLAQVLIWMDETNVQPTQQSWEEAQRLPDNTTLRDVLKFLGVADPDSITFDEDEE